MLVWTAALVLFLVSTSSAWAGDPGIEGSAPIFEQAPFAECHASTLLEPSDAQGALLAAWFGGTEEGNNDVGIWLSRRDGQASVWSAPVEVANGVTDSRSASRDRAGTGRYRYPTWNPVLFQLKEPAGAPVVLFYKVGPNPREWWGEWISSADGGLTWSEPRRLPDGILGPIKNKPIELRGSSGSIVLAGSSTEQDESGKPLWQVHFELSDDGLSSWQKIGPIVTSPKPSGPNASKEGAPGPFGVIQPTLLSHRDGRIQALCRSQQGVVVETWSQDQGRSWSELRATSLPNPNSGLDGVTLQDGRHLVVYNHKVRDRGRWEGSRSRLNVAVSVDGKEWQAAAELENQPGEYSYPAVIQARDGTVHVSYTWRRKRIQHVEIDPRQLVLRAMVDGVWPEKPVTR